MNLSKFRNIKLLSSALATLKCHSLEPYNFWFDI